MLLTRLPAGKSVSLDNSTVARAAWIFPVVGLLVGATGGGVFMLASHLGLGIASAALLAMGTQVLLTGALHEDGLADTADGFGGGRGRERKLEIMRDSRIGTYGVVALVLVLSLRFTALQDIASNLLSISDELDEATGQNSAVIIALIAAGRCRGLLWLSCGTCCRQHATTALLPAVARFHSVRRWQLLLLPH